MMFDLGTLLPSEALPPSPHSSTHITKVTQTTAPADQQINILQSRTLKSVVVTNNTQAKTFQGKECKWLIIIIL